VILFEYGSQDIVFASSDIFPYNDPSDGIPILRPDKTPYLDFRVNMVDPTFDNDDNPYG